MQTITLQVHENVYDKFQWLLSHFGKDEIDIVSHQKDAQFDENGIEYVDDEEQKEIEAILAQRSPKDRELSHSKILTIEL